MSGERDEVPNRTTNKMPTVTRASLVMFPVWSALYWGSCTQLHEKDPTEWRAMVCGFMMSLMLSTIGFFFKWVIEET